MNVIVDISSSIVESFGAVNLASKVTTLKKITPHKLRSTYGTTLYNETGDSKYRAHSLLRKYVRAGWLGRKTKKGVYEY